MTNVNIKRKNNQINKIVIKGHTGYDVIGHDIVCSSISSIVTTTLNAIIRLNDKSITHKESSGNVEINILNHDEVIDILIDNMLDLLNSLSKQYPKNIKINEEV
ncbi:MAG: ribosomal-processing cysteine protease Prp [Bacilli bacterium]|nr:ribosomal-processing cysteine protease Prp [Bacilli bacterium]